MGFGPVIVSHRNEEELEIIFRFVNKAKDENDHAAAMVLMFDRAAREVGLIKRRDIVSYDKPDGRWATCFIVRHRRRAELEIRRWAEPKEPPEMRLDGDYDWHEAEDEPALGRNIIWEARIGWAED